MKQFLCLLFVLGFFCEPHSKSSNLQEYSLQNSEFTNFKHNSTKNYFIGYSGTSDNPFGVLFGIRNFFNTTDAYISVNLRNLNFSTPDYDYKSSQTVLIHSDISKQGKVSYKIDKDEFESLSFQFNFGLHTKLIYNFGLYYGLGYGVQRRVYDMNTYSTEQGFQTQTYKIFDSQKSLSAFSLDFGASYQYEKLLIFVGYNNIGLNRNSSKFSISYLF